jgi:thymidine kinase
MGCMFAGKTTELLRRCRKHEICGKRVFRVKFVSDVRYDNDGSISTHTGDKSEARAVKFLSDLGNEWRDHDVIGVDEGQFFEDVTWFAEMAANEGKIVIISSL